MDSDIASKAYEDAVSAAMKKRYGISWADAAGDVEPLARAKADGWSPEQFVRWFGERYELERIERHW